MVYAQASHSSEYNLRPFFRTAAVSVVGRRRVRGACRRLQRAAGRDVRIERRRGAGPVARRTEGPRAAESARRGGTTAADATPRSAATARRRRRNRRAASPAAEDRQAENGPDDADVRHGHVHGAYGTRHGSGRVQNSTAVHVARRAVAAEMIDAPRRIVLVFTFSEFFSRL